MQARELVLQLLAVHDASLRGVHQQHVAGTQAAFRAHVLGRHRKRARLRREDDVVVVGDDVAAGAQAVAIEHRADLSPVGERDGGGSVP